MEARIIGDDSIRDDSIRDDPHDAFGELLSEFAARVREVGVTAVEERFQAPLTVAVRGRQGVGTSAVAAALAGAGVAVAGDEAAAGADVQVFVIAEVLKPEERAQLVDAAMPAGDVGVAMVVLNKADLAGADSAGPLAYAERRAADFSATVGLPVIPMIAPLATVELGDEDIAALRIVIDAPLDMTSTDAVVSSPHQLPSELRARLLNKLDRFGLAYAVLALAEGVAGPIVERRLRALSQRDRVLDQLAEVAAPLRYRNVRTALGDLRALAAQSGDSRIEEFLVADQTVIAVMAAALDVVEKAGLAVEREIRPEAHLRRAVRWDACAKGPMSAMYQRCAKDITRGSLRLLGQQR